LAELSEKSYLAELISDFPASPDVELDTAWRRVEAHFRAIEEAVPNILGFLAKEKDPFPLLFSGLSTPSTGSSIAMSFPMPAIVASRQTPGAASWRLVQKCSVILGARNSRAHPLQTSQTKWMEHFGCFHETIEIQ